MIYLFWFYILSVVVACVCMVLGVRDDLRKGVDYNLVEVLQAIFCVVCPIVNIVIIFYAIAYFRLANTNPVILKGKRSK